MPISLRKGYAQWRMLSCLWGLALRAVTLAFRPQTLQHPMSSVSGFPSPSILLTWIDLGYSLPSLWCQRS